MGIFAERRRLGRRLAGITRRKAHTVAERVERGAHVAGRVADFLPVGGRVVRIGSGVIERGADLVGRVTERRRARRKERQNVPTPRPNNRPPSPEPEARRNGFLVNAAEERGLPAAGLPVVVPDEVTDGGGSGGPSPGMIALGLALLGALAFGRR